MDSKIIKNIWHNLTWSRFRGILIGLFFIVFVPLALFYYYKYVLGYEKVFAPSDILGFYGTVLSAVITVFVAVFTIQFTKKQIIRQTYVEREKEKWNIIEEKIGTTRGTVQMAETVGTAASVPVPVATADVGRAASVPVPAAAQPSFFDAFGEVEVPF